VPLALRKVVTYERAANPTVQLMVARCESGFPPLPGLKILGDFGVDLPYFGRTGVPLLRIHDQQDHARALIDTASLFAYFGRALLPLHAWTFRLPDTTTKTVPTEGRLPGAIAGIRHEVVPLPLEGGIEARLTHYRAEEGREPRRPVVMIHGYSASGTTFAHPALPGGGLAGELCRNGHDVWVLDLRSSSGLVTATRPWAFEDMGCKDIPAAIDHVHRHYEGKTQVDVVAHCMGAAMLSLGLFGDWSDSAFDTFRGERDAMAQRIHSIVFSQVGPALVMSPANTARAYIAQWMRNFLAVGSLAFQPSVPRTAAEGLLDRLLCAVPYPRRDFFRENPLAPWKRTPWVAQRHRMDAFFGITFDLQGVSDAVLERIDEFFGPMHLDTVAQTIWFARWKVVTDRNGTQAAVDPSRMRAIGHCRVLALHAECNGLVDVQTRETLLQMLWPEVSQGESVLLERMGHQDSLIGRGAPAVYRRIAEFLEG
jgi:cholesterol oxidase